jgi:hypothetical protein
MKLTTKKIIASEFLYLVLTNSIGLIAFLATYLYNTFRQNQFANLENEIAQQVYFSDSLSKPFLIKTKPNDIFEKKTYRNLKKAYGDDYNMAFDNFISKIFNDSVFQYKTYQSLKSAYGADYYYSFNEFQTKLVESKIDSLDIYNYNKSIELKSDIKFLNASKSIIINTMLTQTEQIKFAFLAITILGIFLFPFRYFIYAVKWSLKILRQKQ